jgi:hypothetical protein
VAFVARTHPQQGPNEAVDDRATVPEIFEGFHSRFGFTIDAAASPHNAKLPRYWKGVRLRRENDPVAEGDGWRMGDASSGISTKIESDLSPAQQSFDSDLGENPDQVSPSATRHPTGTRRLEVEEGEPEPIQPESPQGEEAADAPPPE